MHAHDLVGLAEAAFELLAILLEVDGQLRDAGFHGGLGDGGRFPDEHARVERLGNDVLAAEFQAVDAVGAQHGIGHVFLGERGQGAGGGQFHLVVDGGGADVERAAEDEGEAENVVDLVGIVGAAGGDDGVGPGGEGDVVGDFGIGIGQREDDRVRAPCRATISGVTQPALESPKKTSAPTRASARVRALGLRRRSAPCRGSCPRCGLRR